MYTLVLRSGTVMTMTDSAAKALIEQVSSALLRGSPVSVANGCLVRVDDVLLVAPGNEVTAVTEPKVRLTASVSHKPAARRVEQ